MFDEEAEAPIPAAVLQIEDGPFLDEVVVPPNQELPSISPTVPFTAQIEDQVAHPAVHPEAAQSWSLAWDQLAATPTDFDRIECPYFGWKY